MAMNMRLAKWNVPISNFLPMSMAVSYFSGIGNCANSKLRRLAEAQQKADSLEID